MHFLKAFVCFYNCYTSGQLTPRWHVFVINLKAVENHLLLQLSSQSRMSSRVATNYESVFFFHKSEEMQALKCRKQSNYSH